MEIYIDMNVNVGSAFLDGIDIDGEDVRRNIPIIYIYLLLLGYTLQLEVLWTADCRGDRKRT